MAQDSKSAEEGDRPLTSLDNYRLLGDSGLRVSPLCLGTMTFGEAWSLGDGDEEAKEVFDAYVSRGGNFIDTANIYNQGQSESLLGQFIASKRSELVVATKYTLNFASVGGGPNRGGNHRKSLVENVAESLERLGTDHIDLLYLHAWEYRTPIREVMRSLDDVVRSGKALYVGISDTPAWVVSSAQTMAELRGWEKFIALQTRYSLLERSLEFDLLPMAREFGLGIVPWGTMAEGFLAGKYARENKPEGARASSLARYWDVDQHWNTVDTVKAIAEETGHSAPQVALNWQVARGIDSPLVGARHARQLVDNIGALEFTLTDEQMQRLNDVSAPTNKPFPHNFMTTEFTDMVTGGYKVQHRGPHASDFR